MLTWNNEYESQESYCYAIREVKFDESKELENVCSDDVIETIYQNITVAGSSINYNSMVNFNKYNQMVWNDMIADMVKISETYPETIFLVKVYESVNGLNSTFYFKNGKMQYNPVINQVNQFDSTLF